MKLTVLFLVAVSLVSPLRAETADETLNNLLIASKKTHIKCHRIRNQHSVRIEGYIYKRQVIRRLPTVTGRDAIIDRAPEYRGDLRLSFYDKNNKRVIINERISWNTPIEVSGLGNGTTHLLRPTNDSYAFFMPEFDIRLDNNQLSSVKARQKPFQHPIKYNTRCGITAAKGLFKKLRNTDPFAQLVIKAFEKDWYFVSEAQVKPGVYDMVFIESQIVPHVRRINSGETTAAAVERAFPIRRRPTRKAVIRIEIDGENTNYPKVRMIHRPKVYKALGIRNAADMVKEADENNN